MRSIIKDSRIEQPHHIRNSLLDLLSPKVYLALKWNINRWLRRGNYVQNRYLRQRANCDSYSNSLHPFDQSKSIFVHIPKCAGISVAHGLYGNLAGGHKTLDQYLGIFEPRLILSYYKFTIVRNPWDRLVSAYHFLKNGGANSDDAEWAKKHLARYPDFASFVAGWLSHKNAGSYYHFRSQSDYILDSSGKIALDYIGYFENLSEDFEHIAKALGKHVSLPNSNKSQHVDYRSYYDDYTRQVVADVYAKDIALLGYTFDNSGLEAVLSSRKSGGHHHD